MYIMSVYKLNTLLVFYGEWLHSDAIFILDAINRLTALIYIYIYVYTYTYISIIH